MFVLLLLLYCVELMPTLNNITLCKPTTIQLSSLPKYTQLRVNVTSKYPESATPTVKQTVGTSNLFALTDVASAHFLSSLYSIPQGISVQHGSNQSVVEFYEEVRLYKQYFILWSR